MSGRSFFNWNSERMEMMHEFATCTKQNGRHIIKWKNGRVYANIYFKNGLRHGKCLIYYYNGKVSSSYKYKYGKQDGINTKYYENGNPWIIFKFKDGKKHGYYRSFYKDGHLQEESYFVNDLQYGVDIYISPRDTVHYKFFQEGKECDFIMK